MGENTHYIQLQNLCDYDSIRFYSLLSVFASVQKRFPVVIENIWHIRIFSPQLQHTMFGIHFQSVILSVYVFCRRKRVVRIFSTLDCFALYAFVCLCPNLLPTLMLDLRPDHQHFRHLVLVRATKFLRRLILTCWKESAF